MFRAVKLSAGIHGKLYLHSMPGRCEPLKSAVQEIERCGVNRIVCLAPSEEITRKSPKYAKTIQAGSLPCERDVCEVPDFGVPSDRCAFAGVVHATACRLREGQTVLVHCGAGIGRTGMFAICVLLALGVSEPEAHEIAATAGSCPERPEQNKLISWFSSEYRLSKKALETTTM